ncbi:MAG: exo-alpha-sialidase [Bdellovibrionaceae bacterium]|nr:exo-alpha-sialidase [Bdellovibrio sp.]
MLIFKFNKYLKITGIFTSLLILNITYQNCAPKKFQSQSSLAGSNYCESKETDPVCKKGIPKQCAFDGTVMAEGASVTAYLNSTVPAGSNCKTEIRRCSGGVLSGSFSYSGCAPSAPRTCLFDGRTIMNGVSVDAYLNSSEPFGGICRTEKRTCNGGALTGAYLNSSCQVGTASNCLFGNKTVLHGQATEAYERSNVPFGSLCVVKTRTCYNGALDGTGEYPSCVVGQPNSCQFEGKTILHLQSVVGYEQSSVSFGNSCISKNRTCKDGTFFYDNDSPALLQDATSCRVGQPQSCVLSEPAGQPNTPHNAFIDLYLTAISVDGVCATERRTCTNGTLSGSAHYLSCNVLPPPQPMPIGPQTFYNGTDPRLHHQIGVSNGNNWKVSVANNAGFLTYGPYVTDTPGGVGTVVFSLSIDNIEIDNEPVVSLDVFDAQTNKVLARRVIPRQNFLRVNAPQEFDLVYETLGSSNLEFRVYSPGVIGLQHVSTKLIVDRLGLNSLWQNQSHFELKSKNLFSSSAGWDGNTSSLVTLDGAWYAFNRQYYGSNATQCPDGRYIQTVVRKSTDHGITWSDPVVVATPADTAHGAADGCMIVDGSAFFDTETSTWHLLSQCYGIYSPWNLCHYTRRGNSPMGPFVRDTMNPVVKSGQIWSSICNGFDKHCPPDTGDEGTPQIMKKTDDYFYVSFHGFRGADLTGYRGMARSRDFANWETVGADLPNDALQSSMDCRTWIIGCIGAGAASMIRSDGQNYTFVEVANKSLGCTPGQEWSVALLRSPIYAASGAWENYPSNSFIMNENVSPGGCALQYMNIFRDRGEIFLSFGYYTPEYHYPNKNYQLVPGTGPLRLLVK